jgi:hypothetical protein
MGEAMPGTPQPEEPLAKENSSFPPSFIEVEGGLIYDPTTGETRFPDNPYPEDDAPLMRTPEEGSGDTGHARNGDL